MTNVLLIALLAFAGVLWFLVIREVFVKNVVDLVALLNASQARVDEKRAAVAEMERRVDDTQRARDEALRAYGKSKSNDDLQRCDDEDRLLSSMVTTLNERRTELNNAIEDHNLLRATLQRRARRGGYLLRFRRRA